MNILITSGGSVNVFQWVTCFKRLGHKVFTCDVNEDVYKNYVVSLPNESGYIGDIQLICSRNKIDMILPCSDMELLSIVRNQERFIDNKMFYSPLDIVETCIDKNKLYEYLDKNDVLVPEVYDNTIDVDLPVIVKPCISSGSKNTFKIDSFKKLRSIVNFVDKPIIQRYIYGTEYTVDGFVDRDGDIVYLVPRKRLLTKGGLSIVAEIENNKKIITECEKIIRLMKLRGCCMFQCIQTNYNDVFFIEVTPRIAGSISFIQGSGINPFKIICSIVQSDKWQRQKFKEVKGFRYFNEFFVRPCSCGGTKTMYDYDSWSCNRCENHAEIKQKKH
jgi:carbamoyl-phosphate synthase large subunit